MARRHAGSAIFARLRSVSPNGSGPPRPRNALRCSVSSRPSARAGLVRLADAVFEKDGKQIPYRKVSLTHAAYAVDEQTPVAFIIKDLALASATGKNKKSAATPRTEKRAERSEKVVRQTPESS